MTLTTITNGKITKKEYKTYYNLNKARNKAIKTASFIAIDYDDGSQYIYNSRTNLFVKNK